MKSLVIVLIVLILSIIIILTVMNVTNVVDVETKLERKERRDIIDVGKFYSKIDPWENPEGEELPTIPGSSIFTVYTYEKGNGIQVGTPNIKNLIEDFKLKRCHQTITGDCLDPDQILARYESRECKKDFTELNIPCYNYNGEIVSQGTSIQYMSPGELNPCQENLGSMIFNYKLNPVSNRISSLSKALTIQGILVTQNFKNKNRDLISFYEEIGMIDKETHDGDDTIFYPTFTNETIDPLNPRQKLKFVRFQYDTESNRWIEDEDGLFVSIIFRGLNAYLDVELGETGGIKSAEINENETGLNYIVGNNYNVLSKEDKPGGKGCIITVTETGDDGNLKNFTIFEDGINYTIGEIYNVEGGAQIEITSVYASNTKFIFKSLENNNQSVGIKWIFAPPLNLSPNNITRNQTCSLYEYKLVSKKREETFSSRNISQGTVYSKSFRNDNRPLELPCSQIKNNKYPEFLLTSISPGKNKIRSSEVNFIDYKPLITSRTIRDPVPGTGGIVLDIYKRYRYFDYVKKETSTETEEGQIIRSGGIDWLLTNPFSQIAGFQGNYFGDTSKGVNTFNLSSLSSPLLTLSKTGIITQINFDNLNLISKTRTVGEYFNIEDDNRDNIVVERSKFNIRVIESVNELGEDVSYIQSIIISTGFQGSGYSTGDTIKLLSQNTGGGEDIEFTVDSTTIERFRFLSKPSASGSNGFSFLGTVELINNNNTLTNLVQKSSGIYLSEIPGFNYKKGDIVTFSQNTLNGDEIQSSIQTKARVLELTSEKYAFDSPAPISLSEPDDNQFKKQIIENSFKYNFMDGSEQEYSPSPSQLIYGGEKIVQGETTTLIDLLSRTTLANKASSKQLENLFSGSKIGNSFFTSTLNIKTLQYTNLKYTTEDYLKGNDINETSQLVLGKFIPYSEIKPMYNPNLSEGNQSLIWGLTGNEYYNYNNFSFVEYGTFLNSQLIKKCQ